MLIFFHFIKDLQLNKSLMNFILYRICCYYISFSISKAIIVYTTV